LCVDSGNLREVCELVNKSSEVLVKNASQLDSVLETLDLGQHTLGMLAVLCVKLSLPSPQPTPGAPPTLTSDYHEIVFTQVQEFITGCNQEQIRYAPDSCESFRLFNYLT
jgi:COP9 signalosome complex subunit 3